MKLKEMDKYTILIFGLAGLYIGPAALPFADPSMAGHDDEGHFGIYTNPLSRYGTHVF